MRRAAPLLGVSYLAGVVHSLIGVAGTLAVTGAIGVAYAWHLRPFYARLPFDPVWRGRLASIGLVPPAAAMAPIERM
jgi:hypothetical protein